MIVTLVLGVGITACGGDAGSDELGFGDRGLDRCSLVTAEEVEAWIGPLESDPAPSEDFDGEPSLVTCFYQAADSPNSLLIQVYDGEIFYAEKGSAARTGPDVEGLGEDAWSDSDSVKFLQNEWTVSVSKILGFYDVAALMDIAEKISARLP